MCSISCEHMPGALAPSDVPIIAAHLGFEEVETFARECLLASDGATVRLRDGRVISLPTLVPRSVESGACRFLKEGRCSIHEVSPFGCAYIDAHMPDAEFDRRANTLTAEQLEDMEADGQYMRLVGVLRAEGFVATPIAMRRERLGAAMRRERLG
jgi:Fe-S-cluster containining protein